MSGVIRRSFKKRVVILLLWDIPEKQGKSPSSSSSVSVSVSCHLSIIPYHYIQDTMSNAPPPPHYNDIPTKDVKYPTKSYGATPQDGANEPLLGAQAGSSRPGNSSNAWMDQPSSDDLPDDFKVGVAVIDCDTEIRLAFIRKVYSILFVQLLLTAGVSLALYHPAAVAFHQAHPWTIFIPMAGSFVSLLGVYWKRHQHPANLIILGVFTLFEAYMIGTITSFYESRIVSSKC
jgi:hypothetical protein